MFATLWYAGVVVFVMGFESMTLTQCNEIKQMMEKDIYTAYQDPESAETMIDDGFVYESWKVTCETVRLSIDD